MAAARQIKTIYAIGRQLGILEPGSQDDDLHALVSGITGKSSIKELSTAEAETVISALRQRQKGKTKRSGKQHPEVPGGITAAQQRMVWALMYELQRLDKEPNGKPLGLGLFFVRDVVEQLGGRVDLWSSEGKGTVITINLPKEE